MTLDKQVVVVAGSGDIARYLAEEFTRDGTHDIVIISRTEKDFFVKLGVDLLKVEEYSKDAVLPILDHLGATVVVSTLHTDDPASYRGAHEALLTACTESKTCKRLIPSEFLGNYRAFPDWPRGIQRARKAFRQVLAKQSAVK